MTLFATIGATGLYLLFVWLISAAVSAWVAERKGYGERVGLAFGLILSAVGLAIVLLLPARPNSKWKIEGWKPANWRRRAPQQAAGATGPVSGGPAEPVSGGPAGPGPGGPQG